MLNSNIMTSKLYLILVGLVISGYYFYIFENINDIFKFVPYSSC